MKATKLLLLAIVLMSVPATAATWRAPDGMIWGNICLTQIGWQQVYPQPVGTQCYAPGLRAYGFIGNV